MGAQYRNKLSHAAWQPLPTPDTGLYALLLRRSCAGSGTAVHADDTNAEADRSVAPVHAVVNVLENWYVVARSGHVRYPVFGTGPAPAAHGFLRNARNVVACWLVVVAAPAPHDAPPTPYPLYTMASCVNGGKAALLLWHRNANDGPYVRRRGATEAAS